MSFKDIALPLIARGIPVIPLEPRSKKAFLSNWESLATTDPNQVRQWDYTYQNSNCGSVAKAEMGGIWIWELDDSSEVLKRLEKDTGRKLSPSDTFAVRSRKGRGHFYFRQNQASIQMGNLAQGFVLNGDFSARVHNAYCVSPGSLHPETGKPYEVVSEAPIIEGPDWLISWLTAQKVTSKKNIAPDDGDPIPEHHRNSTLTSIGGKLRQAGASEDEIRTALFRINAERCQPPLPDSEVETISRSVSKYEVGKPDLVLVNGKVAGSNGSAITQTSREQANASLNEQQKEYEDAAESADQAAEEDILSTLEYPAHVWEGTPYHDYAVLAAGKGDRANYIPLSYHINSLMTVVGAICGNRIVPAFLPDMPTNFYTVLLSNIGGIGKNEALIWAKKCFRDTGLLYQSGFRGTKNIGAFHNDFASARALITSFAEHPSILQEYGELTTLNEKFGIEGSGDAFLNFILNSYDSIFPNWSLVKGVKLPPNLPSEINDSILGATIKKKWDEKMQGDKLETLIQRLNIVHTDETRTVAILWTPDVSEIRKDLMERIGLLEEYKLVWHYSPAAQAVMQKWHASLEERKHQAANSESDEHETYGRIQVFAHRLVGHMALWKADLPLTPDGHPASPQYLPDTADRDGKPVPRIRRAEGADKQWAVEVPAVWIEKAIEAAEYLIKVRRELLPPPGAGTMGKIQNQIVKWATDLRYVKWPELRRRAHLKKYDYNMVEASLLSLSKAGVLHIKQDPKNAQSRREWVIVWVGDGIHKWKETRGRKKDFTKRDREQS